ncbi:MAG: hypothetical protein JWQ29_218 [Phenylobacterium sp.]|nr:hypothetical protein [Phenylobacterium sp.]
MQTSGPMTLADMLRRSAAAGGDAPALRIDGAQRSYAQLLRNSETRARQMLGLSLTRGDRVGLLLPNSVELVEIVLGAAMIGVAVVPMNTRFKAGELRHLISDSGMRALFTCSGVAGLIDFSDLLAQTLPGLRGAVDPRALALADAPALERVITIDGRGEGFVADEALDLFAGSLETFVDPEDAALLMYTSGTTAKPKGCIVSHRALSTNAEAIAERFALTEKDVWWCPLPMFHIGGLVFLMMMLKQGGFYVGMAHFEPDAAFDQIEETEPTVLYPLFPTITLALTEHPRFKTMPIRRLRYVFDVGPKDVQRKIQDAFPTAPLLSAFGMTETCGTVAYTLPTHSEDQRLTSCGTPLAGWEVQIVDPESRQPLAVGEKGELAVRGVGLFSGYFNDPEHTRQAFTADGFFMTGDAGMLDADGLVYFLGRLKDQLKVGGENVSALEVESLLASHPSINLAQVVGVPDDKYGEAPAAFVELKAGHTLAPEEVIAFCQGKIARFKIPRYVRIVREWPMSATKIQKFRLKAELERELALETAEPKA